MSLILATQFCKVWIFLLTERSWVILIHAYLTCYIFSLCLSHLWKHIDEYQWIDTDSEWWPGLIQSELCVCSVKPSYRSTVPASLWLSRRSLSRELFVLWVTWCVYISVRHSCDMHMSVYAWQPWQTCDMFTYVRKSFPWYFYTYMWRYSYNMFTQSVSDFYMTCL